MTGDGPGRDPVTGHRSPVTVWLVVAAAAIVLAHLGDRWAFEHVIKTNVYDKDWGRLLRVVGYAPLYLVLGLALWLHDRGEAVARAWERGALLVGAVAAGALGAEVLKLLLRRLRPLAGEGEYMFRSFSERPFSTSGLALPSSHTMVAFAGCAMLARLFPRAAPVWYALAAGCAWSRVAAQAHFLSDATAGAVAGIAVTALLWRWTRPRAAAA